MSSPKISIVIPYLKEEELDRCIKSINKQKYKNKEIISGTEKTEGFKERKSIGFMRNYLAKRASGDILLFLDSDAEFVSDKELNKLIELFNAFKKSNPKIVAITGLQIAPKKEISLLNWLVGLDYEYRIKVMGEGIVNVGASTIFAIRNNAFWEINGFVGSSVGEDWNFSEKLNRRGYEMYHTNKIKIYHYTAVNLFGYLKKQFKYTSYRVHHFKTFKKVTDSYTRPSMIVQTVLFFLLAVSLLLTPYSFDFIFASYAMLLLIFFWDMPKVLKLYGKTRNAKVFLLLPLSFIRSFVRAIATVRGFWDFYIMSKDLPK